MNPTLRSTDSDEAVQLAARFVRSKEFRDAFVIAYNRESISSQIRTNRNSSNLSQEELGKRAGMKQTAISRIEDPEHMPTLTTLFRVAAAMNRAVIIRIVSFGELLRWVGSVGAQDDFIVSPIEDDTEIRRALRRTVSAFAEGGTAMPQPEAAASRSTNATILPDASTGAAPRAA